jgi:endonuclease/exonuclease/phosphatase family metal-dependent hydrolase
MISCQRLCWLLLLVPIAGCESRTAATAAPTQPGRYLFCFWNVENLFDDRDDDRTQTADREFDRWFANDPEALRLKLAHLSETILAQNGGRGPDILALAEVESYRAAELLMQALNDRLSDPSLHYQHILMKDPNGGRHIAPAIITRLDVAKGRVRLHGRRQRILEGHIVVNGHDLVVIASHWTSRLTDKDGHHRADYADQIYGLYRGMYMSNPAVDFLVCGDFNDPPDAPSVVEHLHGSGDLAQVMAARDWPLLFNLFAGKDPRQFGTHYFGHHWHIFDQILVSPGLLDHEGWTCDPDSARTVKTSARSQDPLHRPWRFGSPNDLAPRGASDHFPVSVELSVASPR